MTFEPQQILDQLKKNEIYLQELVTLQQQANEVQKQSLNTERFKMFILGGKLILFVVLTWVSIVFVGNMTKNLTSNLNGMMGTSVSGMELGGASDLADEIRDSRALIEEIMSQQFRLWVALDRANLLPAWLSGRLQFSLRVPQ